MKEHDKTAKENIRWHQEQNKIWHNLEANVSNFQLGDRVLTKVNKVPKGSLANCLTNQRDHTELLNWDLISHTDLDDVVTTSHILP